MQDLNVLIDMGCVLSGEHQLVGNILKITKLTIHHRHTRAEVGLEEAEFELF